MPHDELSYKKLNEKLLGTKGAETIEYPCDQTDPAKYKYPYEYKYTAMQAPDMLQQGFSSIFLHIDQDIPYPGADKSQWLKHGKELKKGKLKFHVSLPEDDRENFSQGFDLVKDILIDNQIQMFKVVHNDERMSVGDGAQRGKDITIYANENPEKTLDDWQLIIQQITEALVAANIAPGLAKL